MDMLLLRWVATERRGAELPLMVHYAIHFGTSRALAVAQLRSEVRRPAVTLGGMELQARGPLLPGLRPAAEASPDARRQKVPKLGTLSNT